METGQLIILTTIILMLSMIAASIASTYILLVQIKRTHEEDRQAMERLLGAFDKTTQLLLAQMNESYKGSTQELLTTLNQSYNETMEAMVKAMQDGANTMARENIRTVRALTSALVDGFEIATKRSDDNE